MNMTSKIILFIFLLTSVATANAQPVKEHGNLKVVGTQLTNQYNKAVVLRGMSFGWHNWWPRFYNKKSVNWLATDWKCNVVRAAMGIEPDGAYLANPKLAIEKIESVIEGAIESGIYVIVDWHSHNINTKEAKEFFTKIAEKYGKYPNLIYEIFNEPDEESWTDVKTYSEDLITTIRAIDPDNVILVGSPHWDQDIHIVAADPIKNASNIMYTVHFYAATHKQFLRDRTAAAIEKGIPVFISESAGMEASGDGPINEVEWQSRINWCEERKVSWISWSVADKDETCSILNKSASSTGGWKESDLKLSGIKAREYIRKFNQNSK
jgi:endoglucanase